MAGPTPPIAGRSKLIVWCGTGCVDVELGWFGVSGSCLPRFLTR
ncbi:MAG: hypothetical protein QG608_1669 [Actinomycetota bacterium]|nr:hypothetical protein [Actinomycetota bacterium]